MNEKDDRRSATGDSAGAASEFDRFVVSCREIVQRDVPGMFEEMFLKLDDALYNLADKSESNSLYTTYFDALRVFRRRRNEIFSFFLHELFEAGDDGGRDRSEAVSDKVHGTGAPDRLALMGEAELEENLAIGNLISKAENRYRRELFALRRHVSLLRGKETIDGRCDLLEPRAVCNAFRAALKQVDDVELAIKFVAYKLFDKQVMDRLGDIYVGCLEHAGVEASRDAYRRGIPPGAAEGSRNAVSAGPAAGRRGIGESSTPRLQAGGESMDAGVEIFADLQRLLGRSRPAAQKASAAAVETGELMSALSRLQTLVEPSDTAVEELRLRLSDELRLRGQGARGRMLERSDEDTLDLVFLLFEHILQGNDLPDSIKVLIGRMQIPILQVALEDKSFFDDKRHPARRLLNRISQSAMEWGDDSDRSPDGLYRRIERIVEQVVLGFTGDPVVFEELDLELAGFLSREQGEALARQAKAQQEMEIREQHASARRQVREAMDERLRDGGPVPEAVSSLLYEGWQEVLLEALLRDGTAGEDWKKAMKTVDRLLWSVRPKLEYADRRELLRGIPELLRTLRESLAQVSFDQRRLARWFRELQVLHISALRGAATQAGSAAGPPGAIPPRDVAPQVDSSELSPADARAGAVIEQQDASGSGTVSGEGLRAGTWVEIRRDDGGLMRVKLAWRSPQTGIYLFVDRRGQKALALAGDEIQALMREGTVSILGGIPIVDWAMEEVVRTLKRGRER